MARPPTSASSHSRISRRAASACRCRSAPTTTSLRVPQMLRTSRGMRCEGQREGTRLGRWAGGNAAGAWDQHMRVGIAFLPVPPQTQASRLLLPPPLSSPVGTPAQAVSAAKPWQKAKGGGAAPAAGRLDLPPSSRPPRSGAAATAWRPPAAGPACTAAARWTRRQPCGQLGVGWWTLRVWRGPAQKAAVRRRPEAPRTSVTKPAAANPATPHPRAACIAT